MHAVADLEGPRRRPGRARRVGARADQVVEQRRSRFALGRGADADEAAAALHDVGERTLLLAVEPVAGRVQKYDRAVAREVRSPEVRRAARRRDLEAALRTQIADRRDPRGHLRMPRRARMEHEHLR